MNPTVSVLMPAYNAEEYVDTAIQSIRDQTFEDFELLVVDDCSDDETWSIIQRHAAEDERVNGFRNEENRGVVKTRNKLFELASDPLYYAIFDADDVSKPARLERQVAFLEEHEMIDAVGSFLEAIDSTGERVGRREYPTDPKKIRRSLPIFSPMAQPSVMIRRDVVEAVEGYDEEWERCQDYDLWWRVSEAGFSLANIDEPLVSYRLHDEQGKLTSFHETLRNTIFIKWKHMSWASLARPKVIARLFVELGGFILPSRFTYWLFEKLVVK